MAAVITSFAIYFMAAAFLKLTFLPPQPPVGAVMRLIPPFESFYGSDIAFVVRAPQLDALSDNTDQPTRSNFVIYEGDFPLGPAHSQHVDISENGKGRFSHWTTEGFIFSSRDNRDPRTTGRKYWVVLPKGKLNE